MKFDQLISDVGSDLSANGAEKNVLLTNPSINIFIKIILILNVFSSPLEFARSTIFFRPQVAIRDSETELEKVQLFTLLKIQEDGERLENRICVILS